MPAVAEQLAATTARSNHDGKCPPVPDTNRASGSE